MSPKRTSLKPHMESEVIDKIGALFDAKELQNDKNNQILEKLSEMDDKLDLALLKITQHEVKLMTKKKLSPRYWTPKSPPAPEGDPRRA